MTNQAAQTMPELPPSFARVHNDGYWTLRVRDTAEFIVHDSRQTPAQEVYSSGQMRDMYQQGYAAAERKATSSVFTQQEINFLLRLAHSDRHGGNEVATTAAQKLLTMRSRHAP